VLIRVTWSIRGVATMIRTTRGHAIRFMSFPIAAGMAPVMS
jgi:hypothetical protein